MTKLYLRRSSTDPDGTFGSLQDELGNHLYSTVEPQWLDNQPNISCVPPGWYDTEWYDSPSHGKDTLQLVNVLGGREYCQVHSANWAHQLRGCIALGQRIAMIYCKAKGKEIKGVTSSRATVAEFRKKYQGKKVRLIIENNF